MLFEVNHKIISAQQKILYVKYFIFWLFYKSTKQAQFLKATILL